MAVIGLWSRIDCWLAELLSSFLRTPDLGVALAMYQALSGAEGKRAALAAAAAEALSESPDDLGLFRAVLKAIRPSSDRRNDYAHHLWGISDDLPDAFLLADPKAWVRHNTIRVTQKRASRDPSLWAKLATSDPLPAPLHWRHIKVYERPALANDLALANAAHTQVFFLSIVLSEKRTAATEQVRRMLLSEPPIQRALLDPFLGNTPRAPPQRRLKKPSAKQRRDAALRKRAKK
jgi:hypothetical protein